MLKPSPTSRPGANPTPNPALDRTARAAGMSAAMRAFANAPGSTFFYSGATHKRLMEDLVRALRDSLGLHLVLGDYGTGKTTLCNFVLMAYGHEFTMGYLGNPFVDELEFIRHIAAALGAECPGATTAKEWLDALEAFLRRRHTEHKICVVFVDEAHLLDPAVLDRLLVLSNLQISGVPLLQVVLAGVPGLLEVLATPRFGSLNQRIGSRHWLQPLDKAETGEYVRHRLAQAGSGPELFSAGALSAVQRRSGGRPRLVNLLCRLSLEACARSGKTQVSPAMVRHAAASPAYRSLFRESGMRRGRWSAVLAGAPVVLAAGLALLLAAREMHLSDPWLGAVNREATPAASPPPAQEIQAVPATPPTGEALPAARETPPAEVQTGSMRRGAPSEKAATDDGWRTLPEPVEENWALDTTPEPEIGPGADFPAKPENPERASRDSGLGAGEQPLAEGPLQFGVPPVSPGEPARPAPPPPEEITRALLEKLEPVWGPIRHGQDLPPELAKARVQAIAWSAVPEERMALVGEAIVRIGESLGDGSVATIGEDYVLVSRQGEKYLLQIMPRQ